MFNVLNVSFKIKKYENINTVNFILNNTEFCKVIYASKFYKT